MTVRYRWADCRSRGFWTHSILYRTIESGDTETAECVGTCWGRSREDYSEPYAYVWEFYEPGFDENDLEDGEENPNEGEVGKRRDAKSAARKRARSYYGDMAK